MSESERRFQAIVAQAAVGIVVADLDGTMVEVNGAFHRMLAYDEGELLGKGVAEITSPEDRQAGLFLFAELVAGERESYEFEKRYLRKDGTAVWGRVNTSLIRDDHGSPELVVATIEDIDSRHQAEQQLREAEIRYRTLVEQLPLVTYVDALDERSSNLYTSPQLEPVLGYSVEEWRSDRDLFVKILHPDDRERVLAEVARSNEAGERFACEYRLLARDGRTVWFRDECVTVRDDDGNPLYSQGYLLDIGERKAAEEAVRESEERFRSLADDAPVLIWAADPSGNVTFFSKGWLEFTGRTADQELGSGWTENVHPDDLEQARERYLGAIRGGEPYEGEYRLQRADGTYRWIYDLGRPRFLADGSLAGYIGIGVDVTERREATEQLERRDAVLQVVSRLSAELLRAESWQGVDLLAELGAATDASRAHVVENHSGPDGSLHWSQIGEWVADGVRPLIDDEAVRDVGYVDSGFARWAELLSAGTAINCPVSELPEREAARFAAGDVRSILTVPVFVDGDWWGSIGFVDCVRSRAWSEPEVDALRTTASLLGEAIQRERVVRSLRETGETLEALVAGSPLAIVTSDVARNVSGWNSAAEQMLGWKAEEVLGRPLPHMDLDQDRRDDVLGGETISDAEGKRPRNDGSIVDVRFSKAPLRDAHGEIVGAMAILTDVTGRKLAEDALQETSHALEAIVASSPLPIVTFDREGYVTRWNDAAAETFGWTADEVLGQFNPTLPPGEEERFRGVIGLVLEGKSWRNVEVVRRRKDGSSIDVAASSAPLRDARGDVIRMVAMLADVSDRKRAEDALREREERFRTLVANVPGAIYRCAPGPAWTLDFISDAICEVTGYRASEFIGSAARTYGSIIHPDDRATVVGAFDHGMAERSPFEVEYRIVHADGSIRWVSERSQPIIGPAGEISCLDGAIYDVTEQKRAEQELAAANALLDSIVENLPTPLFLKDANDLRFARVNRAAEDLWGFLRAELLGKSDLDFFPPEQAEFFMQKDREVVDRQELLDIPEEPIETRDLGTRYLHTRKVPIVGDDGRSSYLLGISMDITEAKLARERLAGQQLQLAEQNERLRELDRLKDEFVALVSHELRTPLTSILGYLELVLEGEAGEVTEEQVHFLSIIERNSQRLLRLVGDLLFVAQIEAGKLMVERDAVDLLSLARDCIEAARPRATEKQIQLRLDGTEIEGFLGDRVRLAQLLDNLVSNAIKFTAEGGRVDVRLAATDPSAVAIAVSDTGMGIPKEEQGRLFERFFRATGAAQKAIQGTGLGLTITKAIAEAHGGSIAVASEEGLGTTFVVELPLAGTPALDRSTRIRPLPIETGGRPRER